MKPSPFDGNWEALLLRAVLANPSSDGAIKALRIVQPKWFLVPLHRALWDCIQTAAAEFGALDWVGVLMAMRRKGVGKDLQVTAEAFLNEPIPDLFARPDHALTHVREAWLRREASARLENLQRSMGDMTLDLDGLMGQVHEAFEAVTAGESEDLVSSTFELETQRWLNGDPVHEDTERAHMVRFGLPLLDGEIVSGPGSLGIIAAKPSAGKSATAVQALLYTSRAGFKPMLVSLEEGDPELATRLIACASQLDSGTIGWKGGSMEGSQWRNPLAEARKIRKMTRVTCRRFDVIAAAIRREVARHGIDVIFVDYLTLISPPDTSNRNASTAYQIGEMTKGFKALAMELGVAVVLLSQFNREVKDGERPSLENLRESGQIEQDANWVLFLWTDQPRYEAHEDRLIHFEIAKNRGGRRWVRAMADFDPSRNLFTPKTRTTADEQPEPKPTRWQKAACTKGKP